MDAPAPKGPPTREFWLFVSAMHDQAYPWTRERCASLGGCRDATIRSMLWTATGAGLLKLEWRS